MEPPPSNILMGEQRAKFQPKTLFWNHQGFPVEPLISAVNDSRFLDFVWKKYSPWMSQEGRING